MRQEGWRGSGGNPPSEDGWCPAAVSWRPSVAEIAAAAGTVHFVGYSKNGDGPHFTVILTGAIGDYGPAGNCPPERHDRPTSRWRSTPTCSLDVSVAAATPVVAGSGTGSYRGISGNFNMAVTIDEVDVKPCPGGTSRFLSQLIVMIGSGTVSFG